MLDALTVTDSEADSQFQPNRPIQGQRGTYFNRLGDFSKALHLDLDLVDSVGQALGIQAALTISSESMAILVAFADESNRSFERETVGPGDFEAEFSGVALGFTRKGERKSQ